MTDSVLHQVAAGDMAAVQTCMDRYGGLVWSLALRYASDPTDAEDAVQEIFIDLWKSAARFDPGIASETAFIAMIARRRLIDRRRRRQVRPAGQSIEDAHEQLPEWCTGLRSVETRDEAARAAAALRSLRPEVREVLELSIHQGLSHQEIADRTGAPLGTVKTHARRGLMRIRELLGVERPATPKEVQP